MMTFSNRKRTQPLSQWDKIELSQPQFERGCSEGTLPATPPRHELGGLPRASGGTTAPPDTQRCPHPAQVPRTGPRAPRPSCPLHEQPGPPGTLASIPCLTIAILIFSHSLATRPRESQQAPAKPLSLLRAPQKVGRAKHPGVASLGSDPRKTKRGRVRGTGGESQSDRGDEVGPWGSSPPGPSGGCAAGPSDLSLEAEWAADGTGGFLS